MYLSKQTIFIILGLFLATLVIYFIYNRKNNKKLQSENRHLRKRNRRLEGRELERLKKGIDDMGDEALRKSIAEQIREFRDESMILDSKEKEELDKTLAQWNDGDPQTAVKSLVKVLDNSLSRVMEEDEEFLKWLEENEKKTKKSPVYMEFLKDRDDRMVVSASEFHTFKAIREERHKESHEVGVSETRRDMAGHILNAVTLMRKVLGYSSSDLETT